MILERSEKAKKLREQRKFGKKVGACLSMFPASVFTEAEVQKCTSPEKAEGQQRVREQIFCLEC